MKIRNRHTDDVQETALPAAGSLLAVEAIDHSGLIVTSEGAFVRIVHVIPPNPMILSEEDRAQVAASYAHLVARLRPREALQFYVDARPVNLDEVLARSRREVAAWSGELPTAGQLPADALSLSRWRLNAAMEQSLRAHADDQAAVQFNAYVVVPYLPNQSSARGVLNELRQSRRQLRAAPLDRDLKAHRRALRESLAQTDAVRGELESLSLPTRLLNGEQAAALLWSRFNPTYADSGRRPRFDTELIGDFDEAVDREAARGAATRLREAVARSSLDFSRSRHLLEIDRDVEQTIYTSTTADTTSMGWLMSAMLTRQPFTLSVHVQALDRRSERQRAKRGYRRLFAVNRDAERKGWVPDFDRYAQEEEAQNLLSEMAGHERAGVFNVSIYQSIRARGPEPDLSQLTEAIDYCADQIEHMADCRVSRGEFQQQQLWQSTLPLGRDVAGHARRYVTRNVGDTVPLVGTSCGSPSGIPFAFSDPGRTLELLDPYDRTHSNFTMLVNGRSGSGKTMAANMTVSRCLAHGARAFVLDRAGHYTVLTRLVEGARQVQIGADDGSAALNPWDVDDPNDVRLEKVAFLVALHGVMMGDEGLTTLERAQLGAAVRAVYARAASSGESPREQMLREELIERANTEHAQGALELAAVLRNLVERLGEFCGDGSYAYLLDRETTISQDAPLVVFDTRRCPDVMLRPMMFSIVEYITRTVERHRDEFRELSARADAPMFAGRTVLLIDEAWHLVGRKETGEFANDLARRARHLGLFLIVMSQHLSDFATEHGMALIRNSTMQLLLAQHPDEIGFVQEALQLTDEEAALIGRLKTVKGSHSQAFWVNGSRGKGRVALRLGPVEYWCFTSDPVRDEPTRQQAIAEHDGDVWAAITALASSDADLAAVAAD